MFHNDRRRGYGDNTISPKLPSFNGMCDFNEYLNWKDTMEWVFECNFYSERKKVQLAVSTFVGDAAEWWEVERHCRRFYGDRPLDTWYELTEMLRKRIRQNIDEELHAGMDKIESLFSQWKESSPNPDKVSSINVKTPQKEESLEKAHVEIQKLEASLTKIMEIPEEEGTKSKDFGEESLIEEDDVLSQIKVVSFSLFNDVTSNLLVISKFIRLYNVCLREENPLLRVEKESAFDELKGIEVMRRKKKKKKRNGKRVKEKLFVLDIFQVTLARI